MLSNAYFLAKIRFDTAENEPAKNLQKKFNFFLKFANFANFAAAPRDLLRSHHHPVVLAHPAKREEFAEH